MIDVIRYSAIERKVTIVRGSDIQHRENTAERHVKRLLSVINVGVDRGMFNIFGTVEGFVVYRKER